MTDRGMKYLYVGETCRSAYERGFEHLNDIKQIKPSSNMLKHLIDQHEHENFADVEFRMEVLSFSRTAYERQIMEAVEIQLHRNDNHLLNSRAEFNRSAIPRLGLKLGDKEYKERSGEEREEEEREETILMKIKELKKKRNKERGSLRRAEFRDKEKEPSRKKRRIDLTVENDSLGEEEERIIKKDTEKRRQSQTSGPKKKQMKLDIFLARVQQAAQPSPGESQTVQDQPLANAPLYPQHRPGARQPGQEIDTQAQDKVQCNHPNVQLPANVPKPSPGERQPAHTQPPANASQYSPGGGSLTKSHSRAD